MTHWVLAFYKFTPIENPAQEVLKHKAFFEGRDIKSRIYISHEGINGQMSGLSKDAQSYIDWLHSDLRFADVDVKIHTYHEHVFPRVTVKVRPQLVAMDKKVDLSLTAEHVNAQRWSEMVQTRDENTLILDVRNDYEWELGHFEGAELPKLEQFREFPKYVEELKESRDVKKTKVMMYCTGGIRCELYSALLKQEGFEQVFQLDGGIIKYGLEKGTDQWKGKLFVFDDRLSVPITEKEEAVLITSCRDCGAPSDLYFNCANTDCNELFISCPECAEKMKGCCQVECQTSPRVRAFEKTDRPKPFRRLSSSKAE